MSKPKESENLREKILSTGELPPKGDDNVGHAVKELWEWGQSRIDSFHKVIDLCRRYYRGEQRPVNVPGDMPSYENEIHSIIETMKPKIVDSISDVSLVAVKEEDQEQGESLNQRVQTALRLSNYKEQLPDIVQDLLVDGGVVIGGFADVTMSKIGSKRVIPLGDDWDSGIGIVDQILMTKADVIESFGSKGKRLAAIYEKLPTEEGSPEGAPQASMTTRTGFEGGSITPIGEDSPVWRYPVEMLSTDMPKAQKVMVLGLWARDKATKNVKRSIPVIHETGEKALDENGEPLYTNVDEKELVYPYGRLIYVGVGLDDKESPLSADSSETVVLRDGPNPFPKLFANTGRFPFVFIPCYSIGAIWGMSAVVNLIPMQDSLNALWVKLLQNVRFVVKRRAIVHGRSGIKDGTLTDAENEVVFLNEKCPLHPRDAIYYPEVQPIVNEIMVCMSGTKDTMRDISGVLDVVRGGTEPGVHAGIAIQLLQAKADNRILLKAQRISNGMMRVAEMLAYIAQDKDEGSMTIPDSTGKEREFVEYNADETRDIGFQVIGSRRKSIQEIAGLLQLVADLEAKGISGELVIRYDDDPRMLELWLDLKKEREQREKDAMDMQMKQQNEERMFQMVQGTMRSVGKQEKQEA